jgi:D-glycero-D-manno-heptose 1,7-bisphosphate phosphatase
MKKAIFMDRDGTLVQEVGYLKLLEDLRFTHKATEALRIFRELGYLNLVITNQSAVARGILSPAELKKIHLKLKSLAREDGAVIDGIFFCPHLAEGRVSPYNVDCDCRKPRPGMVIQAQKKYRLNLENSYLVGDKASDLQLAWNAGVQPVLVLTGYGAQTKNESTQNVPAFQNLFEFACALKSGFPNVDGQSQTGGLPAPA